MRQGTANERMVGDRSRGKIAEAWQAAAADLGLTIVTPFILRASDGQPYRYIGWIKDFGADAGTLICLPDQWDDLGYGDLAEESGYYCSGLYAESYGSYNRKHFIETLRDWGWFGPDEQKPQWYAGSL